MSLLSNKDENALRYAVRGWKERERRWGRKGGIHETITRNYYAKEGHKIIT